MRKGLILAASLVVVTGCSRNPLLRFGRDLRRSPVTPQQAAYAASERKRLAFAFAQWKKTYSKIHPRARITAVSPAGDVRVLVYLPRLNFRDLYFYIGKRVVDCSYAGEAEETSGLSHYRFHFPVEQYPDGEYQISVKESSSGDFYQVWLKVNDGKCFLSAGPKESS